MRDYSKMFLGLILTGVVLMIVGLCLIGMQTRHTDAGQARPALSALPSSAS